MSASGNRFSLLLMAIIGIAPTVIVLYRWTAGQSISVLQLVSIPLSWFLLLVVYVNVRSDEDDYVEDSSTSDPY